MYYGTMPVLLFISSRLPAMKSLATVIASHFGVYQHCICVYGGQEKDTREEFRKL